MPRGYSKKKAICSACGDSFKHGWQVAQHVRLGRCSAAKTSSDNSRAIPLTPTLSVSLNADELIQHAKEVMDRASQVVVDTVNGKATFSIGRRDDVA